jgi:hypothetical protein
MKRSYIKRGTKELSRGTKRIAQQSPKKRKQRASHEGQASAAYMVAVKELPCCICHRIGVSDAHHCRSDGMARCNWKTIPLCYDCHQGPSGYHARQRTWHRANGPDHGFIAATQLAILGYVRETE